MTDQTKNAMRQLASSSYWKLVRDTFIIPEMQKINSIYEGLDLSENDLDFKAKYLSKQLAFGTLETIVSKIDNYDKGNKENPISYE